VLVPELNMGQLRMVLRASYLLDVQGLNKVQGQPFKVGEVTQAIQQLLDEVPKSEARLQRMSVE
jgi:2-oxoglutarate/2-oxoacid ferredoxin oxidoreductase subunit alpha